MPLHILLKPKYFFKSLIICCISPIRQPRCTSACRSPPRPRRARRKQPTCSPHPTTFCTWGGRSPSWRATWMKPNVGTKRPCPSTPPTSRPCRDWWDDKRAFTVLMRLCAFCIITQNPLGRFITSLKWSDPLSLIWYSQLLITVLTPGCRQQTNPD